MYVCIIVYLFYLAQVIGTDNSYQWSLLTFLHLPKQLTGLPLGLILF